MTKAHPTKEKAEATCSVKSSAFRCSSEYRLMASPSGRSFPRATEGEDNAGITAWRRSGLSRTRGRGVDVRWDKGVQRQGEAELLISQAEERGVTFA